ncbi:MAG TPA: hypothetical protein VFA75_12310 [Nevskia sp.]|jgi:hypothetical protein|nr:hypothetical protein [Nevskia sp.]
MDSNKSAQGRKVPVMVAAAAMALMVHGAFAAVLVKASTDGQRIYDAWYGHGSKTLLAYTGRKAPARS